MRPAATRDVSASGAQLILAAATGGRATSLVFTFTRQGTTARFLSAPLIRLNLHKYFKIGLRWMHPRRHKLHQALSPEVVLA